MEGPSPRRRETSAGAALGAQYARFSSIQLVGRLVGALLAFGSTIVIVHFLGPGQLGQLALVFFLAQLLSFLYAFPTRVGTIRRVFGAGAGDDDDDDVDDAIDEEEADEPISDSPERSLGTGLLTIALISCVGAVLTVALAPELGKLLGTGNNRSLIAWAALAGGCAAVYRLATTIIWLERRPVLFTVINTVQPILTTTGIVVLVVSGSGIEGAIAGTALGNAGAMLVGLVALRGSFMLWFSPQEVIEIWRRGVIRGPIMVSHWIFKYANVFVLSRFVSQADVGLFHFANKAGALAAYLPAGFRNARRPLSKTTTFAAFEDQHGTAKARGMQLGYFTILLVGTLLGATMYADALVHLAPADYSDSASLIPLMAAASLSETIFRMLFVSARVPNKRRFLLGTMLGAGPVFVGLSLILVPRIGVNGIPYSMVAAFVAPGIYILYLSQKGDKAIEIPYRSMGAAAALAIPFGVLYQLASPDTLGPQLLLPTAEMAVWSVLLFVTGAIPRQHRRSLAHIGRSMVGRTPGTGFDPERALGTLKPNQRAVLRAAVLEGRHGPELAASFGATKKAVGKQLVRALRRAGRNGGGAVGAPTEHDEEIGKYLIAEGSVATHDAQRRRLLRSVGVNAGDLHDLETIRDALAQAPPDAWREPDSDGGGTGGDKRPAAKPRNRAPRASRSSPRP